ncbi:hypothetical protein MVES1_000114 [Malassezia vespertilionis]|uniref:uncharacterized protein n=1 Tax=Malassezia vespertilionis TaxID=2020962 RepID=UPI0024B03CBC|nr:uncharacterized protein MVES1_000114 [Malassezia vespertilionis]WFD04790.1 hypothetical protein MVES1_000114 [Malassezia vespertilionis]
MRATTLRHLRLALNAFLEDAALILRAMDTFERPDAEHAHAQGPLEHGSVGIAGGMPHETQKQQVPTAKSGHPAYPAVELLCEKYPVQRAALFQTFVDLQYAAAWCDLRAVDIPRDIQGDVYTFGGKGWAMLIGFAPDSTVPQSVLPMAIEQAFTTSMIADLFASLPEDVVQTHILLAMMSGDATVVYYKLSRGMTKPVN